MAHKILLVDDEPLLLKLGVTVLKYAGYDVVTAIDGEDALEQAKESQPDLILLDLRLPKLNGFVVFDILQKDETLKKIPVIFATADATVPLAEKVEELHAEGYLLKPYTSEEMLLKIQTCLGS